MEKNENIENVIDNLKFLDFVTTQLYYHTIFMFIV